MDFAILGIGEASSALANDLLASGGGVYGWDPEPKNIPDGTHFKASNPAEASTVPVILSVNWTKVAFEVAEEGLPAPGDGQLFPDLITAIPSTNQRIGEIVQPGGAFCRCGHDGPGTAKNFWYSHVRSGD